MPLAPPVKLLVRTFINSALAKPVAHSGNQQPDCLGEKAGRGKKRMLPAFHHRVRPRTLMTSIGIPFDIALHIADINVFQRWLFDFDSSDVCPLLKLGHF